MEEASQKIDAIKHTRIVYLCSATLALLVLGLIYAWSIFAVPLGEAFGWDRSSLSLVFTISMVCFCGGALIGSYLEALFSVNTAIVIAAFLLAGGFFLTALTASLGIWTLYIFYGVLAGLGCGVGYNTIIATVNLWFPDRVGLSSGVLMMGFGLGSLILGTLANTAMEYFGWRSTFMTIALVGACILVAFACLIRKPPEDIVDSIGVKSRADSLPAEEGCYDTGKMIQAPLFYVYCVWATCLICAGLTLIGDAKQGALTLGVAATTATLLVGFVSATNGVSRVVLGMIYDRRGLRAAMLTATSVSLIAAVFLALSFIFTVSWLYVIAAVFMGFSYGGVPVIASSFARERFGPDEYPRNLAIVNMNIALGAFLSSGVIAIGRPLGGDAGIYLMLCGLIVLAFIDLFFFVGMYRRKTSGKSSQVSFNKGQLKDD